MDNFSLFDFLPEEEAKQYRAIKSDDWKWTMENDYPKEKNGLKVFSCFACGGGSTMGYKLAGCEVLGCCEIDPRMNKVYVENHKPKYNYLMDIRDFNKLDDLPEELYDLDILDMSPPCTTFSTVGKREESWGVKKKFREGQVEQTLDDLAFVGIETVSKLRPKVMIMENVEGLIKGEAWSYVQKIYNQLSEIGYKCHHWLVKGEMMGVPQQRHRVFFIATRTDFNFDKIDMAFNYEPIKYKDIKSGKGEKTTEYQYNLLSLAKKGDENMGCVYFRLHGKETGFSDKIVWDNDILQTITANGKIFRGEEKEKISAQDIINASTFPQDYNFLGEKQRYICGMSVPPIMIKRVVNRLIESGVFNYKLKEKTQ